MRVRDLGEFGLIARIARLTGDPGGAVVGIGDDTAVLDTGGPRLLLATVDIQVEGRHFLRARTTPAQLGRRTAAVNLSDIGAMGGAPRWALVSLALPSDLDVAWVDGFYEGLVAELRRFGAAVIGGNLSGGDSIVIDLTLLGEAERGHVTLRSGAHPGDLIFVTGSLGRSAAGLRLLLPAGSGAPGTNGADQVQTGATATSPPTELPGRGGDGPDRSQPGPVPTSPPSATGRADPEGQGSRPPGVRPAVPDDPLAARLPSPAAPLPADPDLIAAHLTPEPRVREGQAIAATGLATAMLDLSDGLSSDLGHLCDASGVDATVFTGRLPITAATRRAAAALGQDPVRLAVAGGEDYELLLTAPPAAEAALRAAVYAATGLSLTAVGRITPAGDGRWLVDDRGRVPLAAAGWDHFRSDTP